jgi:hypothetical protein
MSKIDIVLNNGSRIKVDLLKINPRTVILSVPKGEGFKEVKKRRTKEINEQLKTAKGV